MPNLDLRKTLFVCTGNVFRSIVAEKMFKQNVLKNGTSFQVRSRGTTLFYKISHPLLNRMVEKCYSITLRNHRARKITPEDIMWATSIICFTQEHKEAVIKMCPAAEGKTFLISDIAPLDYTLFQDVDYRDVFENNVLLLRGLGALKTAVDYITSSLSLSIVMAVYNEEKNIRNILLKLIAQSFYYNVKEIIVISSGSTDNTNRIIEAIKSPLLRLVREGARNGKVHALKKAVPLIRGDIVLLIDGDVDIDGNFIKECFSCIFTNKIPCTGKVVPIQTSSQFFYELSKVSCDAWNILRDKCDKAGKFLYPSGYAILINRQDFIDAISKINDTAINDDGQLALILYKKRVRFHYSDNLRVYITFPQSFKDFFKQKVRTRMGRRQIAGDFFKDIEKSWRKELMAIMTIHNFQFVLLFLIMDAVARWIAAVKIKFSRQPHLWSPVETTKGVSLFPLTIPTDKTET